MSMTTNNAVRRFTTLELADELVRRLGPDEVCRRIGVASVDELRQRVDKYHRG
jgi:hypothetical protein